MEKKQKIGKKKLKFVIVIALGSNCHGVNTQEQYNSTKRKLSGRIFQWAIVLGGNFPGDNFAWW